MSMLDVVVDQARKTTTTKVKKLNLLYTQFSRFSQSWGQLWSQMRWCWRPSRARWSLKLHFRNPWNEYRVKAENGAWNSSPTHNNTHLYTIKNDQLTWATEKSECFRSMFSVSVEHLLRTVRTSQSVRLIFSIALGRVERGLLKLFAPSGSLSKFKWAALCVEKIKGELKKQNKPHCVWKKNNN